MGRRLDAVDRPSLPSGGNQGIGAGAAAAEAAGQGETLEEPPRWAYCRWGMDRQDLLRVAFDEAAGKIQEVCPACQGPSRATSGVVVLFDATELQPCLRCGRPVDRDSRSMVGLDRAGEPRLHVVKVSRGLKSAPALPEREA